MGGIYASPVVATVTHNHLRDVFKRFFVRRTIRYSMRFEQFRFDVNNAVAISILKAGPFPAFKIAFFGLTNETVEVTVEPPVLCDVTKKIVGRPLT